MKIADLREMTDNELQEKLDDFRELLFKRRFESHDEQTKNPGEVRMAKKDVARILTILKERGLEEDTSVKKAGEEQNKDSEETVQTAENTDSGEKEQKE